MKHRHLNRFPIPGLRYLMNKRIQTAIYFLSAGLFFLGTSCTPPPPAVSSPVVSITATSRKEEYVREIQGFCSIALQQKRLKTRLMATEDTGTVTALLMDEFGIPLTVIAGTTAKTTVKSHFPPISKETAQLFGMAICRFMQSIQINSLDNKIVEDPRQKNYPTRYYFTDNVIDSTVITKGNKERYILCYGVNTFSFLNRDRDTVCTCAWE